MDVFEMTHEKVLQYFPDRPLMSHKGDYGKVLLLCGSEGYTGAAFLSAMGALRTGAGLVYLGVPREIYGIEAIKLTEPIVFPLPGESGMLSRDAIHLIQDILIDKDAVLLGPGMGRSKGVYEVVNFVLNQFTGPVVLDADGINVISGHKNILRGRKAPTIITPHLREFSRFNGTISNNPTDDAIQTAKDLGIVVVLKGHNTVITDGNTIYINRTGNPGLATGGSGDVLAGMILSLLGQKLPALESAACAAWLHGKAADICAEEIGQYGMLPSDMLDVIPRLLK